MTHIKISHFLTTICLTVVIGSSNVVTADDSEIYLNSGASTGTSNILFNLDTSGSMTVTVDENNDGTADPATERPRIDVLKEAMRTVLDSIPSLNAGLMR
ncbi:MAG: hypothetical protein ACU84Q_21620, partial [Gammaproteobacteria bacterium]